MSTLRVIWKIRSVKTYPEAHNHLLVGQVTARDDACVELMCRTFHYGRAVNSVKDVAVGNIAKRIIPWNRIEVINELPSSFDYENAKLDIGNTGTIVFSDGHYPCRIAAAHDKLY